ncbi:MAG: hypothetical protein KC646_07600 [Candidatus Cloacimonetes bacterium]|nr:hypothetical protein [Candidatus Cloacimonadota bacterium]
MQKLIIITYLFFCSGFSYAIENNPKEFAEILSLVLSQSKNYYETFEIGIKGRSPRQIKRLKREISDLGFIMNRSRPVQVKVYDYYQNDNINFNIVVLLPDETIDLDKRVLSVAMTKEQVRQGAVLGVSFINNRPILFANSKRLKNMSHTFEDTLTTYMIIIGENK